MHRDPDIILDDLNAPQRPAIPRVMNAEAMASLLGVSHQTVRTAAVKIGRGRFDVAATLRAYLDRLREHAGRAGRPSASGDTEALRAEKLRLTKAQADKEETRVRREQGELVEAAAVTREWQAVLRDTCNALLAVPSRCGAALPHLTPSDLATVEKEIRKALRGLSDGD